MKVYETRERLNCNDADYDMIRALLEYREETVIYSKCFLSMIESLYNQMNLEDKLKAFSEIFMIICKDEVHKAYYGFKNKREIYPWTEYHSEIFNIFRKYHITRIKSKEWYDFISNTIITEDMEAFQYLNTEDEDLIDENSFYYNDICCYNTLGFEYLYFIDIMEEIIDDFNKYMKSLDR